MSRSTATPAATPAAATPTTAPSNPAWRATRRPRGTGDVSSLTVVLPGHPGPPDPGHDLVVDRADRGGPVVGGRLAMVTRTEQDRLVAGPDRIVPAVQHDLIHAHPAGNGPVPAGQPDRPAVGGVPGHPVAVSE